MYCDILRHARYEADKPTDYNGILNFAGLRFESRSGEESFSDLGLPQESSFTPRNNPVYDFFPRALHSQTGFDNSPEIFYSAHECTGLSKKMDGIWNRYNLKSTGRIYTFGVLKYSEKFKVLDLL